MRKSKTLRTSSSKLNYSDEKWYMDESIANALSGGVVGLLRLELERREMRAELCVVIDVRRNLRWLLRQRMRHRRNFMSSRNATTLNATFFCHLSSSNQQSICSACKTKNQTTICIYNNNNMNMNTVK